jgi:hypothetical protein
MMKGKAPAGRWTIERLQRRFRSLPGAGEDDRPEELDLSTGAERLACPRSLAARVSVPRL